MSILAKAFRGKGRMGGTHLQQWCFNTFSMEVSDLSTRNEQKGVQQMVWCGLCLTSDDTPPSTGIWENTDVDGNFSACFFDF
jgi:hypothetical protein